MYPDDESPNEDTSLQDECQALWARVTPPLEEELATLGVHVGGYHFEVDHSAAAGAQVSLALHCRVGPLAWSDRVQHKDEVQIRDRFNSIADATVDDEYEERRRRLIEGLGGD